MKQALLRFLNKYKVYLIILAVFLVWILFFDEYNLIRIRRDNHKLKSLKQEAEYLQEKIEKDRERLNALKTDTAEVEKFARETYLLKKENEDVFVIVEDD
ncbi:MAG: septum formation initiator family protein [Prolixibacteraceae bacterium]|nr:septum formation initiator family protein [Prolixibacteraceae bacterium]